MSKSILITGANRGIGYHIANNVLSDQTYQFGLVILACRDPALAEQAVKRMEQEYYQSKRSNSDEEARALCSSVFGPGRVKYVSIDLLGGDQAAKMEQFTNVAAQVRILCTDFKKTSTQEQQESTATSVPMLDVVVHNAGYGFLIDKEDDATSQQLLEHATQTVQVNFTNTVLLNEALMPLLRHHRHHQLDSVSNITTDVTNTSSSYDGRVVIVGSRAGLLHCFSDVTTAPTILQHLLLFPTTPSSPSSPPPPANFNNLESLLLIGEQYLTSIKEGRTQVKGGMPAVFPLPTTTPSTSATSQPVTTTGSSGTGSVSPACRWPASPYCMSKILIHAYVRLLASGFGEGGRSGVHVSVCTPGYCQTGMTLGAGYRTALQGAGDPTWLAMAPRSEVDHLHGHFIADKQSISFVQ